MKSDMIVRNGRIARLGSFPKKDADRIIDATGMIVTPGLIDINFNAEGPSGIMADPDQKRLIQGGVTTVIGGSNGISLAPILGGFADFMKDWGVAPRFNLHSRSIKEFLGVLGKRGIGVNFGTLVGYSNIRRFFTGENERDLALGEVESAKKMIARSLGEGALGLSTDLASPGARRIPSREILEMVREVAKAKRLWSVRVRYGDENFPAALEEVLEIGRMTGVNVEINRIQPLRDFPGAFGEFLKTIGKETSRSRVNFDVFPHPVAIFPIHTLLPDWLSTGGVSETITSLKDRGVRERILKHLEKMKKDGIKIVEAPPHLKFLEGKSLDEFSRNQDLSKTRALLKLIILTRMNASVSLDRVDKKIFEDFLGNQHSLVSLGSPAALGSAVGGELLTWAEKNGNVSIEKAVAKMTGQIAAKYGLEKRGLVKEGSWADLTLWENWRAKTVIMNGSVAMHDGRFENKKAGTVLKIG